MIDDATINNDIAKLIDLKFVQFCYEPLSHSARINLYRCLYNGGRAAIYESDIGITHELFEDISCVNPTLMSGKI